MMFCDSVFGKRKIKCIFSDTVQVPFMYQFCDTGPFSVTEMLEVNPTGTLSLFLPS